MPRRAKSRVVHRNRKTYRKKPTRRVSIKNKGSVSAFFM